MSTSGSGPLRCPPLRSATSLPVLRAPAEGVPARQVAPEEGALLVDGEDWVPNDDLGPLAKAVVE